MAPPRTLLHHHHYYYLLIVPIILAILTFILLFVHTDLEVAMLYSRCHSRVLLPCISRIPVLGAPFCFLLSFFEATLASVRGFAIMSGILSFIGGLLTVSTVEAARICNGPNVLIAYPTGAWLFFNLIGGALVWELVIIPAFFHRSKAILAEREERERQQAAEGEAHRTAEQHPRDHPVHGAARRHLRVVAEVYAIPAGVAFGFVAPSVAMLVLGTPAAIAVWLFFPVYVSVVRQFVRFAVAHWWLGRERGGRSHHLESSTPSLFIMYAVPIVCSVLAHVYFFINIATRRDDSRELTRSTLRFVEIDFLFIALTVLYWLLVEAGWRVALISLAASLVLGPGAGICVGWYYREHAIDPESGLVDDTEEGGSRRSSRRGSSDGGSTTSSSSNEDTPLLRS